MSYEAWRISFQSSEQAAKAAWEEWQRLRAIEEAARNLCNQKGRHNTEIAMLRLMSVCGY